MHLLQCNIPSKFFIRIIRLILTLGVLLTITVKPLLAAEDSELEQVVIQLKWSHQFQFAGYYAAKEKGFYTEEGFDVVLQELDPTRGYLSPVLNGEASYGVSDSELLFHRAEGKPVILLKQIFQHSPLVLISTSESDYTSPYHLKGKRVMLDSRINHTPILAMLNDTIGTTDNFSLLEPENDLQELAKGRVDAIVGYSTTQVYDLQQLGATVTMIEPRNFGIDFYGDNFFTTENEITEHPKRVDAMIRATIKGWQYALQHPDEIITLIQEKYNPKLSRERLEFEAKETMQVILPNEIPLGSIIPRRYNDIALVYQRARLIKDSDLGKFIYQQDRESTSHVTQFQKKLSKLEQAWLTEHPVLRVGYTSDFSPYVMQVNGKATGFSIEYVNLLAERLGIKIEFVHDTFSGLLEKVQQGKLDLIPTALNSSEKRATFLNFTRGYKDSGSVIVTRNDAKRVVRLEDLVGRTVALVKGNTSSELLEKIQPGLTKITVDDYETALKLVAFGQADATIGAITVFNHLKRKLMLNNLTIAKELATADREDFMIRLAVRKDWPMLVPILEKAMDEISNEELNRLSDRWNLSLTTDAAGVTKADKQLNKMWQLNNLVLLSLAFILLATSVVILFLRFNNTKKNLLNEQFASPKVNRTLVVLANAVLIAIAVVLTWWALENIKNKVKQNMQDSLQVVLNTTQEAIKLWQREQSKNLKSLAIQSDVIALTKRQLQKYQQGYDIKNTTELVALRTLFADLQQRGERLGYFIIAPDGTNIFSMRDANLNSLNLIEKQRPDLLRRALSGEAVMVPPIQSDVQIANVPPIAGSALPATMFFIFPIKDLQGRVIAVLAERYNPHSAFSQINQLGRIGETGETYSFNKQGKMLSSSRFYADLVTSGLLGPEEQSILSLQLRDPGGNLVSGFQASVARQQQPLTRMARSATLGNSGLDVDGYRDYRGVPVMGAWSWNDALGFGIAVEIDLEEAMDAYYSARTVVLVTLSITVIISIISSLLIMLWASRVNRALLTAQSELERRVEQRTLELELSEAMLQLVVDNVPGPVFFKDNAGQYQLVNTTFEQATGLSREHVYGKNDIQLFNPEVAESIMARDNEVIKAGKPNQFEEQVPDGNGIMRDYLTTKVPTDSMGQMGMVGVALDITERKQSEVKLKQALLDINEQRFVLDQHAIVGITDLRGTITYANQKFADISGYSIGELVGENHRMLNSGEHDQKFWQDMYRTVKAEGIWHNEICNRAKDGRIYWVETTIAAFKAEGGRPTAYIAIRTDISERKRYEAKMQRAIVHAEAATVAKSEFVASMSHEIRTPLNGVLGMLDLLSSSDLNDEQIKKLNIAQNSGEALLTLINDILDFSRVEAGKLELEALDFNLNDLFEDITQSFLYNTNEKGLELQLDVSKVDQNMVNGDPSRIRQIVLNLVSNAIKFTHTGQVAIDARLKPIDEGNLQLICRITDTGIGIPEDTIAFLFDSFTQVDASTTRKFGGSGLGLAICKQLCNLMQGEISVTSKVGEGSCFEFFVQLKRVECEVPPWLAIRPKTIVPADLPEWPTTTRILLVEDNQVNQIILKGMLKRLNLTCDIAGNGLEAINSMQKAPVDAPYTLVFMDCQMPELDGYQASHRIRTGIAGERYTAVPIIAMTANAMKGDKEKCLAAGMSAYLAKPLAKHDLLSSLKNWLTQANSRRTTENELNEIIKTCDSSAIPLFLSAKLLESCDNDWQMAKDLLEVFLQSLHIEKGELLNAYHSGDNKKVKNLAHKIKGSITYMAANSLCEQAGAIELLASSIDLFKKPEPIDAFIEGLNAMHTEAKAWLDAFLSGYETI